MKLKKGDPVWVLPQGYGIIDEAVPYELGEPVVFKQMDNALSWGTYLVTMTEGDYQGHTIGWPDIQVFHIDDIIEKTERESQYDEARQIEEQRFVNSIGGTVTQEESRITINFLPGMDTDSEGYMELWEQKKQEYLNHMMEWSSEYIKTTKDKCRH